MIQLAHASESLQQVQGMHFEKFSYNNKCNTSVGRAWIAVISVDSLCQHGLDVSTCASGCCHS